MREDDWLAERFEAYRSEMRVLACRVLGSVTEADDAVQEAWIRLRRSDATTVDDFGGWLTVVGRICLDMLRSRTARREEPFDARPVRPGRRPADNPEQQALLADSMGLALLIVVDTLTPAERVAFLLHDMFAVPHDDIAPIIYRTPPRPKCSPAGPVAGSRRPSPPRRPIPPASGRSSRHSSPRPAAATSRHWSACWTRMPRYMWTGWP